MSYKKTLDYLYGLQKYGIKFGLSKTSNIMKAIGNPHKGRTYIHIGGSNGKGSMASMVESVLVKAGLKVGFYSSPHLVRFTERFRINGRDVGKQKIAGIAGEVIAAINPDHPPTFFEVTTAMALVYFAREKTDISIMEVGMGGRLDATNIIKPAVSVITNISLEHQFFLGNRLMDIAGEKAGIIKRGVDLITAADQPEVLSLFQKTCMERKAPFWRVGKDFRYRGSGNRLNYYGLRWTFRGLELGLHGSFQNRNAALALGTLELLEEKGIRASSKNITEGIRDVSWPGRMQVVSEKPYIIMDGAHNPGAINQMIDSLKNVFSFRRLILVLGIMEDKDIRKIIKKIASNADHVIYTRPEYYRSADPHELFEAGTSMKVTGEIQPAIPRAIERAKKIASFEDLILITGSLFTVGEAMTYFEPKKYRPDGA